MRRVVKPTHQGSTDRGRSLLCTRRALCCRYNVTAADFALITRNVLQSAPHKAGIQWKFAGSVYFSTTVITTIGRPFVVVAAVSGRSHIILAASRRVLRQRLRLWRSLLAPSALSLCATLRRCRRRSSGNSGNSEVTATICRHCCYDSVSHRLIVV